MTQFITRDKKTALEEEYKQIKSVRIPELADKIDDAKQLGDLSENAEYHAAREDMAWAKTRLIEIQQILDNAELIDETSGSDGIVSVGSSVTVDKSGTTREFQIVGAQEADPVAGKISNESPMGMAFLGKQSGDSVEVTTPAGVQTYTIISVV
jgi:transcription elongation factor GreA